jgi:hypothetical protein
MLLNKTRISIKGLELEALEDTNGLIFHPFKDLFKLFS